MARRLLIDAVHPEEIRVAALDGDRLVTVDVDTWEGSQLAGNLYVASVVRVEASLQAAFVEYGGGRHGFLPFSEIHPDYFQLPDGGDAEGPDAPRSDGGRDADEEGSAEDAEDDSGDESGDGADTSPDGEGEGAAADSGRRRRRRRRGYSIQEVVRNRQVMLVQVHKEPRGDKGAALTTYISLAGRYCVLMPNAGRGGGVSRKISAEDRKRLREIAGELDVAPGHGVIIRTAGSERTRPEIKRDYAALLRQWDEIREKALASVAPNLIHQESNLIRRAVRDLYDRDTTEILVEGEAAVQEARRQMRMLTPSHVRYVKQYNKQTRGVPLPADSPPIFAGHGIERQVSELFTPRVALPAGGSIVISPSEALTAIDVNSGRATSERSIEETAYRTNLEAADMVAQQLRLRDISGLVVVDFIDMDEERNRHAVERRFRDRLRADYSRTQIGRISSFGLLEMSRQRLARSLVEMSTLPCRACGGPTRSPASLGLELLRRVETEAGAHAGGVALVRASPEVAEFLVNHKRGDLGQIEARRGIRIHVRTVPAESGESGTIQWQPAGWDPLAERREAAAASGRERRRRRSRGGEAQRSRGDEERGGDRGGERNGDRDGRRGRRSRRGRGRGDGGDGPESSEAESGEDTGGRRRGGDDGADAGGEGEAGRRRRSGRGRRRGRAGSEEAPRGEVPSGEAPADETRADEAPARESAADDRPEGDDGQAAGDGARRRRRGRRGGRGRGRRRTDAGDERMDAGDETGSAGDAAGSGEFGPAESEADGAGD